MEIKKVKNGEDLVVNVDGRIDTTTAPELEKDIIDELENVTNLIFDFEKVQYISSAGLRVILVFHKNMSKKGKMTIKNVNEAVQEIFDVTGFSDLLNIE